MAEGGSGVLREVLASFGFEVSTEGLKKGENALASFGEKLKGLAEGFAAAFAVDQIYEFAEGQAHVITQTEHMAAQLGIATEAVQAWQYAAKASGFEADKFTTAMSRLQLTAGNAQGVKTFKALGINVKDASGHAKDASTLFADVSEAISKTEDPNKRAAIATQLFGRAGRELLPFFSEGREGIEKLNTAFKKYGELITGEDIDKTKKFEGANADLGEAFKALKLIIARDIIPIVTKVVTWVAKGVAAFKNFIKGTKLVEVALAALGAAALIFAIQMAIANAPLILMGALFAGLILVVEDLVALFKGDENSQIGEWIDKAFGKGQSAELVKSLKSAWDTVVSAVKSLAGWLDAVIAAYNKIVELSGQLGDTLGQGRVAASDAAYSLAHPTARSTHEAVMRGAGLQVGGDKALSANPLPELPNFVGDKSFQIHGMDQLSGPMSLTQNIYAAPGMDEKQLGKHVASHVAKVIKRHTRDADAGRPRSSSP